MRNHAEICPVCKGTGKYKDCTNCNYTATIYVEKICHGCYGKGWVEVTDDYTTNLNDLPQGTVVFSDSEEDMNRYYREFCEKRDINSIEFCDEED